MRNRRNAFAKKLNVIYKHGYLPSRGTESYKVMLDEDVYAADLINCYGHACFNLTNRQLKEFGITSRDTNFLWCLWEDPAAKFSYVAEQMEKFIRSTGLKVARCKPNEKTKSNQWKIAVYYQSEGDIDDYHFMLQEKSGIWSSKLGASDHVDTYDDLPRPYYRDYTFYATYIITNPYVQAQEDLKNHKGGNGMTNSDFIIEVENGTTSCRFRPHKATTKDKDFKK